MLYEASVETVTTIGRRLSRVPQKAVAPAVLQVHGESTGMCRGDGSVPRSGDGACVICNNAPETGTLRCEEGMNRMGQMIDQVGGSKARVKLRVHANSLF
ncbi:hypothetical protein MES4922_10311 [Mesorhizobium ventifaucium]|uniref:Uncharacterized protein n=1 Tax=Mesorhizobium ventifaucium TaxID=666020 RepID=A0ABM9DF94_9HYPH|nr:hypothetical protein MES4922_10311 [Mesorhizobium ventifaucium]